MEIVRIHLYDYWVDFGVLSRMRAKTPPFLLQNQMVFLSPRTNLYGGQKSSLQHGRLLAFLFPSLDFLWASIKADWESPSLYLWSRKSGRKIHTCKNLGKIGKNVDTKKSYKKLPSFICLGSLTISIFLKFQP